MWSLPSYTESTKFSGFRVFSCCWWMGIYTLVVIHKSDMHAHMISFELQITLFKFHSNNTQCGHISYTCTHQNLMLCWMLAWELWRVCIHRYIGIYLWRSIVCAFKITQSTIRNGGCVCRSKVIKRHIPVFETIKLSWNETRQIS